MRIRLLHAWNALRTTFWFVPSLFAAATVPFALALLAVDEHLAGRGERLDILYGGDAEGARNVLVMLAGSMLGTAGVVFSITIVALSQTSSQYGPRLLRNFLRDPGNQVVLGTFVATFLYCLLVLREIHEAGTLPVLSVTVAVALSVASLGVLIYFFHHVAASIQAGSVVAAVGKDLERAIGRFCERHGEPDGGDTELATPGQGAAAVCASHSGYVQIVDHESLVEVARERDACIQALHRAGGFVFADAVLARVAPAAALDDETGARVRRAFVLGDRPTEDQDLEFSVRQLVEVALRALSPGINDPFTAITCIDWLGSALARLGGSGVPRRLHRDGDGRVRLVADAPTFAGVADAAFQQIRQAAGAHVAVSLRLLEVFAALGPHLRQPADREAILAHADHVLASALEAGPIAPDRAALAARHAAARRALAGAARAAIS